MNKKLVLSSLSEIANNCDEKGLFVEANALTNVMLRLSQNYLTFFDDKIQQGLEGESLSTEYYNWYSNHLEHAFEYNNLKEAKALYQAGLKKITTPSEREIFNYIWNEGLSKHKNGNWNKNADPRQLATVNSPQPTQKPARKTQKSQQQTLQQQLDLENERITREQQTYQEKLYSPQQPVNQQQNMSRAQIAQQWINQTSPTVGNDVMKLFQMAEQGKLTAKTEPERLKFNDAMAILKSHPNYKGS